MADSICKRCGRPFQALRRNAVYCGGACRTAAHRARKEEPATNYCAQCGAPIGGHRRRVYCGDACRVAAYRNRRTGK